MNGEVVGDPYEVFVERNPELGARIQVVVDKGRACLERGALAEARREFHRALALFPHVPAALNNLALLEYGEGDRDRAAAYLRQLLEFSPAEPTANALMARYWSELGAMPLAFAHAETAAQSTKSLCSDDTGSDPTRARRALEFTCQTLAALEDDYMLVRLYRNAGHIDLMPVTLVHVAIAFYNRGDLAAAMELWQRALGPDHDLAPARIYLDMARIIEEHDLLPFRLDHRLDIPQPEKGRRVWLIHVPSVFLAAAMTRLYQASGDEVEEALSLLTAVGLPGIDRILRGVGGDITRPVRLRLLAGLHLADMGEINSAARVATAIPRAATSGEEEALWCLVHGLLAEAHGDAAEAMELAGAGARILEGREDADLGRPFRRMLDALAERVGERAGLDGDSAPGSSVARQTPDTDHVASLALPDAEWLRLALQGCVAHELESVLIKRRKDDLVELARRMGEQVPEQQETEALVRRLAMRMRSLQLERVVGTLSTSARGALQRLVKEQAGVSLPELHRWLATGRGGDPWLAIEALYRAGVIDIGRSEECAGVPLRPEDVAVVVPADLRDRF